MPMGGSSASSTMGASVCGVRVVLVVDDVRDDDDDDDEDDDDEVEFHDADDAADDGDVGYFDVVFDVVFPYDGVVVVL